MTAEEVKTQTEEVKEENVEEEPKKKRKQLFSWPLFQQSVKSTWLLWLLLAVGAAAIFVIINLVVSTKKIFTNIDMNSVTAYVEDEDLSWLKLLGFLETMGFSLSRIQTMSQIDMNSVMNDLIYKIAGVLLPMVYVMITANKLIAAQVSDGSMAYILSTPTNRKKVLRTQYFFLISSLFAMYLVITSGALISEGIANIILRNTTGATVPPLGYRFLRTTLYCFGSFMAIFALSGICFGASAWCNKSNKSIAIGGGVSIICFLCCVLGLFGNKVFVAVGVGVKAMDFFNYLTLFSLIDTESMNITCKAITGVDGVTAVNLTWLWELAILFAIGIIGTVVGSVKFVKKDLPL